MRTIKNMAKCGQCTRATCHNCSNMSIELSSKMMTTKQVAQQLFMDAAHGLVAGFGLVTLVYVFFIT